MGFFRQEYWSRLPFPAPGDLPNPGIEPGSPALQADSLPAELPGKYLLSDLGMWDPSFPTRDGTYIPCIAKWMLIHWTTQVYLSLHSLPFVSSYPPFTTPPISHSALCIAVHKSILKSCLILVFSPEVKALTSQYFLECPFTLLKDPTSSCTFKSVHPANIT